MRSFRVSCVFRIVRVKRLVRIVNLYDPGSVLPVKEDPEKIEQMYVYKRLDHA